MKRKISSIFYCSPHLLTLFLHKETAVHVITIRDSMFMLITYIGRYVRLIWVTRVTKVVRKVATNYTYYMNPEYKSAWRVGGRYECNFWDAGVRYTDFCNTTKRNLSSSPFDEEYTQIFKFDWNVVDIELGYNLPFNSERYILRPFVGAKFAWVKESYRDEQEGYYSKQDFDGDGLYLGVESRYLFCRKNVCCNDLELSFLFWGSYGILDSTSDTHEESITGNDVYDKKKECLFISTVEVFAGLDLAIHCSDCFTPHLLIGYESHTMIGWREMDSTNDCATLGLGGLVVRFGLDF